MNSPDCRDSSQICWRSLSLSLSLSVCNGENPGGVEPSAALTFVSAERPAPLHSLLADLREELPGCDHALLGFLDFVEQLTHGEGEGARLLQ